MIAKLERTVKQHHKSKDWLTIKKAKIRNRYNQVPHLTRDTIWESDKTQENIKHKSAKRSARAQQVITRLRGTDKTPYQRQKGSTKEAPPWNGQ